MRRTAAVQAAWAAACTSARQSRDGTTRVRWVTIPGPCCFIAYLMHANPMSVRVCIPISNHSQSQRGCYTDEVSFPQLLAILIGRSLQHDTIVVGMALAERVYGATGRGCGRYR